MTPAGIETATFRFVAQHLKHCATTVPLDLVLNELYIYGLLRPKRVVQLIFKKYESDFD